METATFMINRDSFHSLCGWLVSFDNREQLMKKGAMILPGRISGLAADGQKRRREQQCI
jgi:hypothetical protein